MAILKRLTERVASVARRGENWDANERRFILAICLTTYGHCYMVQGEFKRAKRLASLALRCHKSENSEQARVRDIQIRIKSFTILTIVALFSEDSVTASWYRSEAQAALTDWDRITGVDLRDIRHQLQLQTYHNYLNNREEQEFSTRVSEMVSEMPSTKWQMPRMAMIRRLTKDGGADDAKKELYKGIEQAQKTGNTTAEGAFHADLAEICIESSNWLGACMHILHLERLFRTRDYGAWRLPLHYDISDTYDRLYRYARYGCVFLRLKNFSHALLLFARALKAAGVVNAPDDTFPDEPEPFIDVAMTIIRANLCLLVGQPRTLISPKEFNALDDLGQVLVMSYIRKTWPQFDIEGKGIADRLRRAYDILEAPNVGGPPGSQPRPSNVISLTKIVVDLSKSEAGDQKLGLGFRERGLEMQLTVYDEHEDPDLDAIEDKVAFSRGVVKPDNPR